MENFWVRDFLRYTRRILLSSQPNSGKSRVYHEISTNDINDKIVGDMQMTQKSNTNTNAKTLKMIQLKNRLDIRFDDYWRKIDKSERRII